MKTYKSIIIGALALMFTLPTLAQTVDKEALYVYQNDGTTNIFFRNEVTGMSIETKDGVQCQVIKTGARQHAFPISKIQSIGFVNPDEDTYKPSIIVDDDAPTFGKFVDLGLPSGTMWASFNVGASSPEEFGGYYAWGETEEKELYDSSTAWFYHDTSKNSDICGTENDAAHVKWGGAWRLPTYTEVSELYNNCTRVSFSYNGVRGVKFTSKFNNNSIFIPYSGYRIDKELKDKSLYWMVNPTWLGTISSVDVGPTGPFTMGSLYDYSGAGLTIRPVCNLHVSNDAVKMVVGESQSVGITAGSGSYTIESSDDTIVNLTMDGDKINIEALKAGEITISVLDILYGLKTTIAVNVVETEAVDLGLPSGTKWASFNVGATKPEESGGYYAWGEIEEKGYYGSESYIHYDSSTQSFESLDDISGTEYDVAHMKWGGSWQMPSNNDFQELLDFCTREWVTINGVNCRKFTSNINGNSIFLPASGYRDQWPGMIYGYKYGNYWSSTQHPSNSDCAYYLFFGSGYADQDSYRDRSYGLCVRPVVKPEPPEVPEVPAEAIDLGLPSGTKWATCNVGATKPEENGGYYAWGETEEKNVYSEDTYKFYQNGSYVSLGSDISGTVYDVAHMKWGGKWCMPTFDDISELSIYCTCEKTTLNGVNGIKYTGPNGNSIFLPVAGWREGSEFIESDYYGPCGQYMSSTECKYPYGEEDEEGNYHEYYIIYDAYCLWVNLPCPECSGLGEVTRWSGNSVRPVVRN